MTMPKPVVKLRSNWRDGSLHIDVLLTPNNFGYSTLQLRSDDVQQRLRAGQLNESSELATFNRFVDDFTSLFTMLGCEVIEERLT